MTVSPLGTGWLGQVKAVAPWRACLSSCLESLPIHPQAVEVEPVRETEADGVYPPTPHPQRRGPAHHPTATRGAQLWAGNRMANAK